MIGRRGRAKKVPDNYKDIFPHLSTVWVFAWKVSNRLFSQDGAPIDYMKEETDFAHEEVCCFIGNSILSVMVDRQDILRDTALGILIAAKSQYWDFLYSVTDLDIELAIEIAEFVNKCIDEIALFEKSFRADRNDYFDLRHRFPNSEERIMECLSRLRTISSHFSHKRYDEGTRVLEYQFGLEDEREPKDKGIQTDLTNPEE